jgi:uncharacterized damage-inducible protein DinB
MPLTIEDFIEGVRSSRRHFLKHLNGLTPEQIVWKPYPECKNVLESLQHLIVDDMMALESMQTGEEPNYEAAKVEETEYEAVLDRLAATHTELTSYLEQRFGGGPLEAPATAWGAKLPAARAIAHLSSEDYYHAGQVAFIRMATEPGWDYYDKIYG